MSWNACCCTSRAGACGGARDPMPIARPMTHPVESRARMRQVNAAGRGDKDAAADLLDELFPRMRNLVRYLVRNDSDVEDFTQDAAMAVLRSFQGYRGEGYFERWVDRVVMRAIFGARRRRRAERAFAVVDG